MGGRGDAAAVGGRGTGRARVRRDPGVHVRVWRLCACGVCRAAWTCGVWRHPTLEGGLHSTPSLRDTPSALVEWDKSKIVKHQ
eukprot:4974740-Prymnesium_polylepis.2